MFALLFKRYFSAAWYMRRMSSAMASTWWLENPVCHSSFWSLLSLFHALPLTSAQMTGS